MSDIPKLYRVILQVKNLERAVAFYEQLLGIKGRRIPGSRHYFDCGAVILALLDPTAGGIKAKPIPDYIYFAVSDLKKFHTRAKKLGCLSQDEVHGEKAGEIVKRPWSEKSFYIEDPFGNGICFVDEKTVFTGERPQA